MTVVPGPNYTDWMPTNGVEKNWPYDFTIFEDSSVVVLVRENLDPDTIEEVTSDFSRTAFTDSSGYVTYPVSGAALAGGYYIRILRRVEYEQTTEIGDEGSFNPKIHERALDNLALQIQQLAEISGRAVASQPDALIYTLSNLLQDGDTLMISGDTIIPGPNASEIQAAESYAESAKTWAETAESAAKINAWYVDGPFVGTGVVTDYPLTYNPFYPNNVFVLVEGVTQLATTTDYEIVQVDGLPHLRISVPAGNVFEVRYGNVTNVEIGERTANSVSTAKIQNEAVTTSKLADGATTTTKLADEAVTTDKLVDGAATRAKIGDAAINAAKLTGDAGEIAAIVAKLGVTPSKLLSFGFLANTATTSTTSTTSFSGSLSDGINFVPTKASSKVLCLAQTRCRVEAVSMNDSGARVGLYRWNDSAYVAPANLFFANDIFNTDNPVGPILRDFTLFHAAVILSTEKRSNGSITVRTMGNTVYAGTLTHQSTVVFFIEYED